MRWGRLALYLSSFLYRPCVLAIPATVVVVADVVVALVVTCVFCEKQKNGIRLGCGTTKMFDCALALMS